MNLNEMNAKLNEWFKALPQRIKEFPTKFKQMTMGEQIAYVCIAVGVLLIIISLFLF